MSGTGHGSGSPEGPPLHCPNQSCDVSEPPSTVHEREQKTVYRCPICREILQIDQAETGQSHETDERDDERPVRP